MQLMVGVLIITHNRIGEELLDTAETIIGKSLPRMKCVSVPADVLPDDLGLYADLVKSTIEKLNEGDGVLILTDLYGSTPSNLAHYFAKAHYVRILAGLNLPMLMRVINYSDQPLELLAKIGIVGANKGITDEKDV